MTRAWAFELAADGSGMVPPPPPPQPGVAPVRRDPLVIELGQIEVGTRIELISHSDNPKAEFDANHKAEMRAAVRAIAEQGVDVLLISSELDELTAAADRVLLMVDGRITRALTGIGTESGLRALLQADMAARRGDMETSAAPRQLEAA